MIALPLAFVIAHFVGDFLFQSDWMALNKSRNWAALGWHAFVYSACFAWLPWQFFVMTYGTHYCTDAITSRITSRLWFLTPAGALIPGRRHWFFVVIGLDQAIHYLTLAWTAHLTGVMASL